MIVLLFHWRSKRERTQSEWFLLFLRSQKQFEGERRYFKFLRTCGGIVGGLTYSHFKILRLVIVSRLYGSLFMLLGVN